MCEIPQIVFLGAGGVGKTSILQQFMFGTFQKTYVETVEEVYSYNFLENGKRMNLTFLDTAGNISFPAMRQLYLSKAHAFVLVYSIKDESSFSEVKSLWEQIKKVRPNILDIPCVIVGNNLDEENVRQVETFDALNWACSESLGGCFVETSAKEDKGIQDIFSLLLEQFLTRRHEQKGPFKLRSLSLHKLHIDPESKIKGKLNQKRVDDKMAKHEQEGKLCEQLSDKHCQKINSPTQQDTKGISIEVDAKIKRSRTDGVIELCKSQGRRKLHLF